MLLIGILILNFAISWWNAYVAGSSWVESRMVGGGVRLMVWCAAIQSAVGFSMVIVFALTGILSAIGQLPAGTAKLVIELWYVAIIVPALGSGLAITLHGWVAWYRDRSLLQLGVNVWNTYAMIHNAMGAIENLGDALGDIGDAVSSAFDNNDDPKLGLLLLAVLVVGVSLLGGVLLTALLIKHYAGTIPLPGRVVEWPGSMIRRPR